MPKSLWFEKKELDRYFGNSAAATVPSNWYLALLTTNPTATSDSYVEVSGGSYARITIPNNTTNFPAATSTTGYPSVKALNAAFSFPTPTAGWGTVTGFGLFDSLTVGQLYYWGAFSPAFTVASGTPISVGLGQLLIKEA